MMEPTVLYSLVKNGIVMVVIVAQLLDVKKIAVIRMENQNCKSKEMAEGVIFPGLRDLIGYEVYRDNQLIDFIEQTEYLDTSNELWYLVDML